MAEDNFNKTACCIGTGPSLTMRQIQVAQTKGFTLIGCNHVVIDWPQLDYLYGCNWQFWKEYSLDLIAMQFAGECWSSHPLAQRYAPWVNYLNPVDGEGLTPREPYYNKIYHGHSTGFQAVQLAYLLGFNRIVLLGYDMKYAPDYDGKARQVGSTPRHYFGEYQGEGLQHWPSQEVNKGVHTELVRLYGTVARDALIKGVEIINASADTALDCFPRMPIEEVGGDTHFL